MSWRMDRKALESHLRLQRSRQTDCQGTIRARRLQKESDLQAAIPRRRAKGLSEGLEMHLIHFLRQAAPEFTWVSQLLRTVRDCSPWEICRPQRIARARFPSPGCTVYATCAPRCRGRICNTAKNDQVSRANTKIKSC